MSETATVFTEQQIDDWHEYESVRQSGAYNMFDPRARKASGLTAAQYSFVMQNYSALKKAASEVS
jgi:hypothetical protein